MLDARITLAARVGESINDPQLFIVVVRCNKADDQNLKIVYVSKGKGRVQVRDRVAAAAAASALELSCLARCVRPWQSHGIVRAAPGRAR
jgi:hypothetical protein